MSKILEVAFDDYVRRPESQHNTNVLRTSKENDVGVAAVVDTLEQGPVGVTAVKTVTDRDGKATRFTSLYPWWMIKDVKFEPVVLVPAEESKPAPKVKP